jgi:hypothetical protein
LDSELRQGCPDCVVIGNISGETAEGVDNDEADSIPVGGAMGKEVPQRGTIRRLGRLALFHEDNVDIGVMAAAVFDASLLLRGQTEVLKLFLGGDPAVDDCTVHLVSPP